MDLGEIQKLADTPEELTKDDFMELSASKQVRKTQKQECQKLNDIRQPGRKVLIIQDCICLLLWHGCVYDTDTETKQMVKEEPVHRHVFREMKREVRQKCQVVP